MSCLLNCDCVFEACIPAQWGSSAGVAPGGDPSRWTRPLEERFSAVGDKGPRFCGEIGFNGLAPW